MSNQSVQEILNDMAGAQFQSVQDILNAAAAVNTVCYVSPGGSIQSAVTAAAAARTAAGDLCDYVVLVAAGVSRDYVPVDGVRVVFEEDDASYRKLRWSYVNQPAPLSLPYRGTMVAVCCDDGADVWHTETAGLGACPDGSNYTHWEYARDCGVPVTLFPFASSALLTDSHAYRTKLRDLIWHAGFELGVHPTHHETPESVTDYNEETTATRDAIEAMVFRKAVPDGGVADNGAAGIRVRGFAQSGPWNQYPSSQGTSELNLRSMKRGYEGMACTTNVSTNVITAASAHGLSDGDAIYFTLLYNTTGISESTTYYVRDSDATTFKIALTAGGDAIDLTGTNGGMQMWEVGVSYPTVHDADGPFGMLVRGQFEWSRAYCGSSYGGPIAAGWSSRGYLSPQTFAIDGATWDGTKIANLLTAIANSPGVRVVLLFHGFDGSYLPTAGFKALCDGLRDARDAGTIFPVTMSTLMRATLPRMLYEIDGNLETQPSQSAWGGVLGGYMPNLTWANFKTHLQWRSTSDSYTSIEDISGDSWDPRPYGVTQRAVQVDAASGTPALRYVAMDLNLEQGRSYLLRYDAKQVSGSGTYHGLRLYGYYQRRNLATGYMENNYRALASQVGVDQSGILEKKIAAGNNWGTVQNSFYVPEWCEWVEVRLYAASGDVMQFTNIECAPL